VSGKRIFFSGGRFQIVENTRRHPRGPGRQPSGPGKRGVIIFRRSDLDGITRVISARQLSIVLDISQGTVMQWVTIGDHPLPATRKPGCKQRTLQIKKSELVEWLIKTSRLEK